MSAMEQFEAWLDYMPDFLDEFRAMMREDGVEVDFTPRSLDAVEKWILNRYSDTDEMIEGSESQVVNLVACYIGEMIIRHRGGKWDLQLDPEHAFYGLPILRQQNGDVECPLTLATAAADRRTGNYLRRFTIRD